MSEKMQQPAPVQEQQIVIPETLELDPKQREFLEKKMDQYERRMNDEEKHLMYVAPEVVSRFSSYYDAVAKWAAVKLLLGGKAEKKDVHSFTMNTAKEFWQEQYNDKPDAVQRIMQQHQTAVEGRVENAWAVLAKYNAGDRNIPGSQPV